MNETKTVLEVTEIEKHLSLKPTPITQEQLMQDFNYHKAQEVAKTMLNEGLISLSEFNKLTQINRETFSPLWVEIMPEIT